MTTTPQSMRTATLPDLFAAQAMRTPDAIAVSDDQEQLSYAELAQRSYQLAHHLHTCGVDADTLVSVAMQRRTALLVGLLGVLAAGAAYIPLDLQYPADRLRFMLDDSRATIVLTNDRAALPTLPTTTVIDLEQDWPLIAAQPTTRPSVTIDPVQLAYVIYTSGSTGRPKGVQIPHQALSNFLSAMQREPGLCATDTLLAVTTISFDIAGLELFLPLTIGARVVLASREVASDGQRLAALLHHSGATVMQATPATWRLLLESGWRGDPALTVLCGGEALPRTLADQVRERVAALWNMYGPTETTIWSMATQVNAGPITIGRPIANTEIYLLDQYGQPVARGAEGELYIGGAGLARGYLNQPALTATRFVPDPWGGIDGARLYRTGDLARLRDNDEIEFLGRVDQQIKLRGFRIEPGEIESVLLQHPMVTAAAVVAYEERLEDRRLVAYVVGEQRTENGEPGSTGTKNQEPRTENGERRNKGTGEQGSETAETLSSSLSLGPEGTPSALRSFLAQHLPSYMIPSAFVVLDALPLTPNGKLDRRALSQRDFETDSAVADTSPAVPPRTDLEYILTQIWSQVLGQQPIGVHDNFITRGGHSLLATQIVARINKSFQRTLQVRQIFETPTVAQLAAWMIAAEPQPGQTERIAQMQRRLAGLPPEERQKLLERFRAGKL